VLIGATGDAVRILVGTVLTQRSNDFIGLLASVPNRRRRGGSGTPAALIGICNVCLRICTRRRAFGRNHFAHEGDLIFPRVRSILEAKDEPGNGPFRTEAPVINQLHGVETDST
jgi:hypothetical protein